MRFCLFTGFLLLSLQQATVAFGNDLPPKRVLLISWDGLRPEMLSSDRFETPHLREQIKRGAHSLNVQPVDPTLTYPNHATLVTGVSPAKHGILSNTVFDPEKGNSLFWYWYAKDIRVPTLWQSAHEQSKKVVMLRWPATVGAGLKWNIPEYFAVAESAATSEQLLRGSVDAKFLKELEQSLDSRMPAHGLTLEYDQWIASAALEMEKKYQPDLQLVHLAFADYTQHQKGLYAEETLEAVKKIDHWIGKFSGLAAHRSDLCVMVVGDHGHANFSEIFYPNALLAQQKWLEFGENESIRNWRAIVHVDGPQGAVYLKPGVSLKVVRKIFKKNAPPYVRILDADQLKKMKFHPQAAFGIVAQPGYSLGGGDHKTLTQTIPQQKSTHGYLSTEKEMKTALVAFGCGIAPQQDLGPVHALQVAPTVAQWLALKMTGFEAKALTLRSK